MEPPKCPLCKEKHYGVDHIFKDDSPKKRDTVTESVTKPATGVTKRDTVTHCPTCTCGAKKVHQSNAERQRAYRARKA
jgi:hypothetical protein